MSDLVTYPLRLPRSLSAEIVRVPKRHGCSINQFVAMAAAKKLAALDTQDFFQSRAARADFSAFYRIMERTDGAPPREGDEREPADGI